MTGDKIELIPIEQIRIANPRTRNKIKWLSLQWSRTCHSEMGRCAGQEMVRLLSP
jgi:hypothetical protein